MATSTSQLTPSTNISQPHLTSSRPKSSTTIFKPHLLELASSLNHLRTEDTLTDITVHVDNRHFGAHKVVLAACSHYFKTMFTSGFQESKLSEVRLSNNSGW